MKHRIALGIEYDGTYYHGWQRQSSVHSVQQTLESALSYVADHLVTLTCAGRTDAWVHATMQVAHFETHSDRTEYAWLQGTNTELSKHGESIRILWVQVVPKEFDARRSAITRTYRYFIYNHPIRPSLFKNYVSWHYKQLKIELMKEAAQYWIGEHDFSSFRAAECQSISPYREIFAINITINQDIICLEFKGNAFLHHMIRNMSGVLMAIGEEKEAPIWAKEVLDAKDRRMGGFTAPPQGLYLVAVDYPEVFGLPTVEVGPWMMKQK